ncbi:MAG: DUF4058 family protein [Planctomycetota bacterium]|jgi:hypothetical protein
MAGPFPGMDPYLESPAYWPDFHHTFISCWREILADRLPDSYDARIGERVNLVQLEPDVVKLISPDVAISQGPGLKRVATSGRVAMLEPALIPQTFVEEIRESYIEILHRPDRSLVSVLELLSPTNKTGSGFYEYEYKRSNILKQNVHLFELDLLRLGDAPVLSQPLPPGDYRALLTRAERRSYCNVYTFSMRQSLPMLPIPLRAPDPDLTMDLQAVFELAYQRGRYARSVRYDQPTNLPLPEVDRVWIAERLREKVQDS